MSTRPGGSIVIGGAGILDDSLRAAPSAVFYNLTFMNLYRDGRSYPRATYLAWLADAGFVTPRFVTLASPPAQLFSARRGRDHPIPGRRSVR